MLKQGPHVLPQAKAVMEILSGHNPLNKKYPFICVTNGGQSANPMLRFPVARIVRLCLARKLNGDGSPLNDRRLARIGPVQTPHKGARSRRTFPALSFLIAIHEVSKLTATSPRADWRAPDCPVAHHLSIPRPPIRRQARPSRWRSKRQLPKGRRSVRTVHLLHTRSRVVRPHS